MKKLCAIACTVGFSAFWIFGGLAAIGLVTGQAVGMTVLALSGLGLAVGLGARLALVQMTRSLPRGTPVRQQETPAG